MTLINLSLLIFILGRLFRSTTLTLLVLSTLYIQFGKFWILPKIRPPTDTEDPKLEASSF